MMSDGHQDLQDHYDILRLPHGARLEEVERAFQALEEEWRLCQSLPRFQIQEAYRFLSDPEKKAAYDAQRAPKEPAAPSRTRPMILGGILTVLFVIGGFVFPGFLLGGPERFNAGDVLVHTGGKGVLGRVLRVESSHHFPNAVRGRAYLIESNPREQRWYPAGDLERYYHRRPAMNVTSERVGGD